ncbi:MAG: HNH endonuclease [Actinomycetota bacterium]
MRLTCCGRRPRWRRREARPASPISQGSRHIPNAVRERVRSAARDRCGFCLAPQRQVYGWLEIEHIVPKAAGGTDDEDNLWLACDFCNT